MSEELNRRKAMRIVAAMKKPACFLLFLLLAAPAFAQTGQQFGILFGGAKRLYSGRDKDKFPDLPNDRFRLTHGVREVFYAVQIEPSTMFKIQAGQWNTDVGVVEADPPLHPRSGHMEHVDGIVDYRFTEPFGTTGLFGGIGLYRWSAPTAQAGESDIPAATNYGYVVGVNGEFPMTRRYAFMVEGAYHWVNMSSPVRYVTLTGGLRIGF
jgi:hypothetical protein